MSEDQAVEAHGDHEPRAGYDGKGIGAVPNASDGTAHRPTNAGGDRAVADGIKQEKDERVTISTGKSAKRLGDCIDAGIGGLIERSKNDATVGRGWINPQFP